VYLSPWALDFVPGEKLALAAVAETRAARELAAAASSALPSRQQATRAASLDVGVKLSVAAPTSVVTPVAASAASPVAASAPSVAAPSSSIVEDGKENNELMSSNTAAAGPVISDKEFAKRRAAWAAKAAAEERAAAERVYFWETHNL
jgi:hypothetical protein